MYERIIFQYRIVCKNVKNSQLCENTSTFLIVPINKGTFFNKNGYTIMYIEDSIGMITKVIIEEEYAV